VTKVLWLDKGITGDDTHGHVDDLARFTDRTTVVTASRRTRRTPTMNRSRRTSTAYGR
jgi:agmatine deiminase